jgi:hypothetical protein
LIVATFRFGPVHVNEQCVTANTNSNLECVRLYHRCAPSTIWAPHALTSFFNTSASLNCAAALIGSFLNIVTHWTGALSFVDNLTRLSSFITTMRACSGLKPLYLSKPSRMSLNCSCPLSVFGSAVTRPKPILCMIKRMSIQSLYRAIPDTMWHIVIENAPQVPFLFHSMDARKMRV